MFSRIIKYLGLFIIVAFSAVSIFFSLAQREIEDPATRQLISYTSFFEDRFYDMRMLQTLKKDAFDKRIVLVAITDETLEKIGKWPIPRSYYATLMRKLKSFGAKVIAYDVLFSEKQPACTEVSPEQEMAEAMTDFQSIPGNKVILPYTVSPEPYNHFEELPESMYNFILDTKQREGLNLRPSYLDKANFPLKIFQEAEAGLAYIVAEADADGIFRHYKMAANSDTLYFPSLALSTYQYYTGDSPVIEMLNIGENRLKLDTGTLSLNYKGEAKVRWLGSHNAFPAVAFHKLIEAEDGDPEMKEIFNGNMAFIASTAIGAHDLRHSPVDAQMPGVYFHMNMTHMLLEGKFFVPDADSTLYSWAILVAGTLAILIVMFFNNPLLDLVAVIALTGGLYYYDTYYLLPQGYEIKLFFCLFSIVACYSWNTFLHFYLANKDKAFLKSAFGSYISPELIDEMYSNGEPPKLGGDSGIRTAYFTDIQGFSSFSEKLTATQLVELLNEYLTHMTDILLEEKGTLDKYEGDAIIAFFGAPLPLEDHADRACTVAYRMQERLLELREKWTKEGDKWPQIVKEMRMRIGINSGEIVTGNMGSASRMNYTMMGDSVNLAARLEESAKQYGIFTQVAKECVDLTTPGKFLWRELDTIQVVGKSIPTTTFELLGLPETAPDYLKTLSEKFKQGIELYKSQKFQEAKIIFQETLELEYQRFPELKGVKTNPSEIYIGRCEEYIKLPPPPDWNGVWVLTSK